MQVKKTAAVAEAGIPAVVVIVRPSIFDTDGVQFFAAWIVYEAAAIADAVPASVGALNCVTHWVGFEGDGVAVFVVAVAAKAVRCQ